MIQCYELCGLSVCCIGNTRSEVKWNTSVLEEVVAKLVVTYMSIVVRD